MREEIHVEEEKRAVHVQVETLLRVERLLLVLLGRQQITELQVEVARKGRDAFDLALDFKLLGLAVRDLKDDLTWQMSTRKKQLNDTVESKTS